MHELALILHVLWPYSFVMFAVAFVSMLVSNRYIANQEYGTARIWTLICAIASTLVLVFEVLTLIATLSPFAGFMIFVWGYFTYASWSQFSRLS